MVDSDQLDDETEYVVRDGKVYELVEAKIYDRRYKLKRGVVVNE